MLMTLALCALATQAHAQRVYKCSDGKQVAYQSVPCPKEHDTGVSRPVVRDPNLTSADRVRVAQESSQARRWVRQGAGYDQPDVRGTVIDNVVDPQSCEDARLRKEMAEVFTGRSAPARIDQEIHRACAVR
jgi:hypothetical protein